LTFGLIQGLETTSKDLCGLDIKTLDRVFKWHPVLVLFYIAIFFGRFKSRHQHTAAHRNPNLGYGRHINNNSNAMTELFRRTIWYMHKSGGPDLGSKRARESNLRAYNQL
jgi:hypothetical protein